MNSPTPPIIFWEIFAATYPPNLCHLQHREATQVAKGEKMAEPSAISLCSVYLCSVAKAAPYVIQNLTDLEVNISGKIILECRVGGTPEPQITWRKNGYPISAASGERTCCPSVLYGTRDNRLARLPQTWDLQPHSDCKNG